MTTPVTPAQTAQIDQALATSGQLLEYLVDSYRRNEPRHGDIMALATIATILDIGMSKSEVSSVLLAAVQRIARLEGPHP